MITEIDAEKRSAPEQTEETHGTENQTRPSSPPNRGVPESLQKKISEVKELLSRESGAIISIRWEIGKTVQDVIDNPETRYGANAVDRMAQKLEIRSGELYKAAQVYEAWPEKTRIEELKEYTASNGKKLTWSHLEIMARQTNPSPDDLMEQWLENGWSTRELKKHIEDLNRVEDHEPEQSPATSTKTSAALDHNTPSTTSSTSSSDLALDTEQRDDADETESYDDKNLDTSQVPELGYDQQGLVRMLDDCRRAITEAGNPAEKLLAYLRGLSKREQKALKHPALKMRFKSLRDQAQRNERLAGELDNILGTIVEERDPKKSERSEILEQQEVAS